MFIGLTKDEVSVVDLPSFGIIWDAACILFWVLIFASFYVFLRRPIDVLSEAWAFSCSFIPTLRGSWFTFLHNIQKHKGISSYSSSSWIMIWDASCVFLWVIFFGSFCLLSQLLTKILSNAWAFYCLVIPALRDSQVTFLHGLRKHKGMSSSSYPSWIVVLASSLIASTFYLLTTFCWLRMGGCCWTCRLRWYL